MRRDLHVTQREQRRMRQLREQGLTWAIIGQRFGVTGDTAMKAVQRADERDHKNLLR